MSSSINDNRDLFKFDTRWAKKINRDLSFKISDLTYKVMNGNLLVKKNINCIAIHIQDLKNVLQMEKRKPWNNGYDLRTIYLNSAGEEVRIEMRTFAIDDENYELG